MGFKVEGFPEDYFGSRDEYEEHLEDQRQLRSQLEQARGYFDIHDPEGEPDLDKTWLGNYFFRHPRQIGIDEVSPWVKFSARKEDFSVRKAFDENDDYSIEDWGSTLSMYFSVNGDLPDRVFKELLSLREVALGWGVKRCKFLEFSSTAAGGATGTLDVPPKPFELLGGFYYLGDQGNFLSWVCVSLTVPSRYLTLDGNFHHALDSLLEQVRVSRNFCEYTMRIREGVIQELSEQFDLVGEYSNEELLRIKRTLEFHLSAVRGDYNF
jgi:hypothetical protein